MKHLYKLIVWLLMAVVAPVAGFAQSDTVVVYHDTTVCESYQWFGTTLTTTGTYGYVRNIGDSTVVDTLHLTVNYGTYHAFSKDTCGGFVWHGTSYGASGVYTYPYINDHNCPSVDTLHLTVNQPTTYIQVVDTCESFTWIDGNTYTESTDTPTYLLTNAAGCDSIVTLHLTIHHGTYTADRASACERYTWHNSTYCSTDTYTYPYTNADGCESVDTLHLTIYTPTHYSNTVADTGSYTWVNGDGQEYTSSGTYLYPHPDDHGCMQVDTLYLTIIPLSDEIIDTAVCASALPYMWHDLPFYTTGNYTYSYQNASGNLVVAQLNLTVNPLPNVTISGENSFCEGASTTLTANGATTYSWNTSESTPSITVNTSGTYSVTGTDGNGCSNTATFAVAMNPLPTVTISGETAFCLGESTTLTASGATTYTWGNETTAALTVTEAGTYTVTGTDANNCVNTTSVEVTVNALPTVTIIGEISFCAGESTILTATGAMTYIWNTSESAGEITVSHAGSYSVVGTDGNGCANTASIEVTENPVYHLSIEAAICANELPYHYENGDIDTTFGAGTPSFSTVNFYLPTSNGCDSTITLALTVYPSPEPFITGDTQFCPGDGTFLTASGGVEYAWSTGETANQIYVFEGDVYTVTVTDSHECTASADVVVEEIPSELVQKNVVSKNHADGTPYMLVYPQAGLLYQWYKSGERLDGETRQYYIPSAGLEANILYTVQVRPQIPGGCGIWADWSWDGTMTGRVSIVPNPNDGHFTLLLPAPAVSVSVYSATGEVVFQKELSGSDRVNVNSGLANGLYLLKIVQEGGTIITEKLIINK